MTLKTNKKISIEVALIWLALITALVGFVITIIGAILNGFAIFNGSKDLSAGFGLILIGDSIALLGVALIFVLILYCIISNAIADISRQD